MSPLCHRNDGYVLKCKHLADIRLLCLRYDCDRYISNVKSHLHNVKINYDTITQLISSSICRHNFSILCFEYNCVSVVYRMVILPLIIFTSFIFTGTNQKINVFFSKSNESMLVFIMNQFPNVGNYNFFNPSIYFMIKISRHL